MSPKFYLKIMMLSASLVFTDAMAMENQFNRDKAIEYIQDNNKAEELKTEIGKIDGSWTFANFINNALWKKIAPELLLATVPHLKIEKNSTVYKNILRLMFLKGDFEQSKIIYKEAKNIIENGDLLEVIGATYEDQKTDAVQPVLAYLINDEKCDFSEESSHNTVARLLNKAVEEKNTDLIKLFITAKVDLAKPRHWSNSPLSKAFNEGNAEILKLLIANGAISQEVIGNNLDDFMTPEKKDLLKLITESHGFKSLKIGSSKDIRDDRDLTSDAVYEVITAKPNNDNKAAKDLLGKYAITLDIIMQLSASKGSPGAQLRAFDHAIKNKNKSMLKELAAQGFEFNEEQTKQAIEVAGIPESTLFEGFVEYYPQSNWGKKENLGEKIFTFALNTKNASFIKGLAKSEFEFNEETTKKVTEAGISEVAIFEGLSERLRTSNLSYSDKRDLQTTIFNFATSKDTIISIEDRKNLIGALIVSNFDFYNERAQLIKNAGIDLPQLTIQESFKLGQQFVKEQNNDKKRDLARSAINLVTSVNKINPQSKKNLSNMMGVFAQFDINLVSNKFNQISELGIEVPGFEDKIVIKSIELGKQLTTEKNQEKKKELAEEALQLIGSLKKISNQQSLQKVSQMISAFANADLIEFKKIGELSQLGINTTSIWGKLVAKYQTERRNVKLDVEEEKRLVEQANLELKTKKEKLSLDKNKAKLKLEQEIRNLTDKTKLELAQKRTEIIEKKKIKLDLEFLSMALGMEDKDWNNNKLLLNAIIQTNKLNLRDYSKDVIELLLQNKTNGSKLAAYLKQNGYFSVSTTTLIQCDMNFINKTTKMDEKEAIGTLFALGLNVGNSDDFFSSMLIIDPIIYHTLCEKTGFRMNEKIFSNFFAFATIDDHGDFPKKMNHIPYLKFNKLNSEYGTKESLLHTFIRRDKIDTVKALVEVGADISEKSTPISGYKNVIEQTPLELAQKLRNSDAEDYLTKVNKVITPDQAFAAASTKKITANAYLSHTDRTLDKDKDIRKLQTSQNIRMILGGTKYQLSKKKADKTQQQLYMDVIHSYASMYSHYNAPRNALAYYINQGNETLTPAQKLHKTVVYLGVMKVLEKEPKLEHVYHLGVKDKEQLEDYADRFNKKYNGMLTMSAKKHEENPLDNN